MAEGDGVAKQGICVRLDGPASESDIPALRSWLERERLLEELMRKGALRIEERPRTDESGAPMGLGTDILITLVNAAAGVAVAELVVQVKKAVRAWKENRRTVESGDPPSDSVEPVDVDDR
ncbi:hypothetical protein HCJ93_13810 [Streptomyces sp. SBST2-5]|uniref:Uncharacterized protein n=1 Tax=Streptomyces composti TaxID=2720025 RepID=A0ABX1ABT9_9ACTN|nr:hypothetical protein [Streptomyces composti]NJP51121.1 hypothetical protein [Streptomyces composti]